MDVWTEISRSYDEVVSNLSIYQEIRDRVVLHFNDARIICDQGCGTGVISLDLAKQNKIVNGIDNNPYMLARAKEKITDNLADKIFLEQGDAEDLPYQSNVFDGCVANNVIFYVGNPDKMLKESYRILKPKGKLVIVGPRPNPDIERLAKFCYDEFREKGLFPEFEEHLSHFLNCNRYMKRNKEMDNTYNAEDMVKNLSEVGFSRLIEASNDIYLGISYLVAMEK